MNHINTNIRPPALEPGRPIYPPLIQMIRVTSATVSGPSGSTQVAGSSVLGPMLYVAFTQQMRSDGSLLPRDREPCLADDVNGLGLAPGFYLGRLAGTWTSLPVYEIAPIGTNSTSGMSPDAAYKVAGKFNLSNQICAQGVKLAECWAVGAWNVNDIPTVGVAGGSEWRWYHDSIGTYASPNGYVGNCVFQRWQSGTVTVDGVTFTNGGIVQATGGFSTTGIGGVTVGGAGVYTHATNPGDTGTDFVGNQFSGGICWDIADFSATGGPGQYVTQPTTGSSISLKNPGVDPDVFMMMASWRIKGH